eukprot:2076192-Prorocentrum_lima.AAC.1
MHPSMWLMIKGKKPSKLPWQNPFLQTSLQKHTHGLRDKSQVKGQIALFVDDMLQTGAKASNI